MDPILLSKALSLILLAEGYHGTPGDGGKAVGPYQIHMIYLNDVNRILKKKRYKDADRLDPVKSREMATIYITYYGTPKRLGRPVTAQDLCRIHNGGPNGWKERATTVYWSRILNITKGLT